jgi:hypothetical protein
VCFTRLVEDYARKIGRPVSLLTAPLALKYGSHAGDGAYPVWENNPFVDEIINSDLLDLAIMKEVAVEKDNHFQFAHVIYNVGAAYGVPPRIIRPSLFPTSEELKWALSMFRDIPRPVVCLSSSGGSMTPKNFPWHFERWLELIERSKSKCGLVQIGRRDHNFKSLPIPFFDTSIRQAFALICACDGFIGFDSGLAHVAAAFSRPSAILWDAVHKAAREERKEPGFAFAAMSRWGYPFNRNVLILGERDREVLDVLSDFLHLLVRPPAPSPLLNG